MGGWGPGNQDFDVSYITMASEGDAIDFGENNTGGWGSTGASDSVRALSAGGGYPSASATIDMFLFSSVGVKYDWGDITAARGRGDHGVCSPVRAIFTGGYGPIHARYDTKITASTGNTTDFGEIMYGGRGGTAIGDRTRGIITGGYQDDPVATAYVNTNRMEAIQLQSTGVAVDFGEISDQQQGLRGGAQNMVRGIVFGGAPSSILSIDMVNFQTYGSAAEFGEMATGRHSQVGLSDSHGGLGGY